ncbi:hypothetical protein Dimus_023740 [Dionaea muscipula]
MSTHLIVLGSFLITDYGKGPSAGGGEFGEKRTRTLVAEREGKPVGEKFPSLVIGQDEIVAKGSYAQAQARCLFPDELAVSKLVKVLREKKIGIVAHFYMDPEVQGVLTAAQRKWPHIHISDSLVMADRAVKMAEAGCQFIAVLGVDFMSENVRAILDQAGFGKKSATYILTTTEHQLDPCFLDCINYYQMNSLSALLRVCRRLPDDDHLLSTLY